MRGRQSIFGLDGGTELEWSKTLGKELEVCETPCSR
jgi:hypothetical protein